MSVLGQTRKYWRLAWGLREFLREPMTLEQSRQIIKQRLENRERNLLAIVKNAIYENTSSPYLKLLRLAGCEYEDFERLVLSDGIESALKRLYEEGIYLSIEEFKGKKELVRFGKTFTFGETDFNNPFVSSHIEIRSGASRSSGTRSIYDFDFVSETWTSYFVPMLEAFGVSDIPIIVWFPILPGIGPLMLLILAKSGNSPLKWCSFINNKSSEYSLINRMGTNYIVYMGRLFGARFPSPEYIPLNDAWKIADWVADRIEDSGGCCIRTYTSAAVRICQAAKQKGLDISGAKFIIGGEPITQAKRSEIESTGAHLHPLYGFLECGITAAGCFNPAVTDDFHFFKDSVALIQQKRDVHHAEASVDAFLFTTLTPLAPKVLLNVESGDYGTIETRSCGCIFEEIGFTDHIHNIRSFDKLTGEGVTFVGTDLLRLIEEVLPSKFGGTSTDYQILEEEDESGHTRINVIVSDEVGEINEVDLIQTVLSEIGKGEEWYQMMVEGLSQANTIKVKRTQPYVTARGKLLPLHIRNINRVK